MLYENKLYTKNCNPSWILTYFHRFTCIKVGPTYLLHTLDSTIMKSYDIHPALLILHSSMIFFLIRLFVRHQFMKRSKDEDWHLLGFARRVVI
jgi:hypothetical protein